MITSIIVGTIVVLAILFLTVKVSINFSKLTFQLGLGKFIQIKISSNMVEPSVPSVSLGDTLRSNELLLDKEKLLDTIHDLGEASLWLAKTLNWLYTLEQDRYSDSIDWLPEKIQKQLGAHRKLILIVMQIVDDLTLRIRNLRMILEGGILPNKDVVVQTMEPKHLDEAEALLTEYNRLHKNLEMGVT